MDFTDLNEKARKAELDHREVMSLLSFYNFRRERNGEPRLDTDYNYSRIFNNLEDAYPDLTFRRVNHRVFAAVRPRGKGALVEKIGFVSGHIPHLAITGVYGFDGVCVTFRADGVGVIKEGSCGMNSSSTILTWRRSDWNAGTITKRSVTGCAITSAAGSTGL